MTTITHAASQFEPNLRRLVHYCYGDAFPVKPGRRFPADVQDPGAFPSSPYHLAFWGFPCDLYSGLQRSGDPTGVRRALSEFDAALHRLQDNPPQVFVLENTASLFAHPSALSHICRSLAALSFNWRSPPHSHSPCCPLSTIRAANDVGIC